MKDSNGEAKLDAPLRLRLTEAKQAQADAPLKCLVKVKGSLDDRQRKALEDAGVRILTVVKEIATIEGQPEAIRRVANYDFVHSISLSQTRYPLEKQ